MITRASKQKRAGRQAGSKARAVGLDSKAIRQVSQARVVSRKARASQGAVRAVGQSESREASEAAERTSEQGNREGARHVRMLPGK